MLHLHKKWLPTVLLAVALHIVVFAIAYSALKPQSPTESTKRTSTDVLERKTPAPQPDPLLINTAPTRVMTMTETKPSDITQASNLQSDHRDAAQTRSETAAAQSVAHKHDHSTQIAVDNSNTAPKTKPSTHVSAQKNTTQAVAIAQVGDHATKEAVLEKNDMDLLAGDVAITRTDEVTDETYQAVKSEAEGINDQLRAAINEIKHRNQSKIEQAQPPKTTPQAAPISEPARNPTDNESDNSKDRTDNDAPMTAQ